MSVIKDREKEENNMQPIIKKENILFDVDAKDKADMIEQMVEVFSKEGYLSNKEQFHKDVLAREDVFSTYIGFGIADKAGIGPGFIGAYLAREIGAGFLGGILAGFIAGYTVKALKKIKLPTSYKALGNIFIYPLVGTLVSGGIIVFFLGQPIAAFMNWMTEALNGMSGAAKAPLGMLLGAMVGVDMGGPINKVAYTFAQTQVDTLPYLMGWCRSCRSRSSNWNWISNTSL